MDYTKPTTELKELINSNTEYSLIDGLQILDNFFNELSEANKQAFTNWLESNFSFEIVTDYRTLNENFDFYRTINYFIEDKSFNFNTAVNWLEGAKRAVVDDITTIKIKEGIEKPMQLLNEKERIEYLQKLKTQWFDKLNEVTQNFDSDFAFNPLEEKRSIKNKLTWVKIHKRSTILFYLAPKEEDRTLLPNQQFRQIVFPSLQAYHIFNWIKEQIELLSKPVIKDNPNLKLEELFKKQSQYQYIRQVLIDENYINSVTNIWIDSKKGNLSVVVCLIKSLFPLGYLNQKPTIKQIQVVAKNSFKVDIGIDTIKKTKEFSTELPNIVPIKD